MRSYYEFYRAGKTPDWIIPGPEMKYLIFVSGTTTHTSHSKTLENQIGLGWPLLGSADGLDRTTGGSGTGDGEHQDNGENI